MNAPAELPVDRRTFLGSSDMAAILGLSPWQTPLELWEQKMGIAAPADADPEKARLFRRGKRMEPVIVSMLEEEMGLKIIARNQRYTDSEFPFLKCEIDAETILQATHTNVECKSAHPFTAWKYGSAGTDETPIEYTVQAMFGLMITGRKRTLFGVLFGTDNLVPYHLPRDEQIIAEMRRKAVHFWEHHIQKQIPPDPINLPDVERMLRRTPARELVATPEVEDLIVALETARAEESAAKEGVQVAKFKLGKLVLGPTAVRRREGPRGGLSDVEPTSDASPLPHVISIGGQPRLQIVLSSRSGTDLEMLRNDFPEVASKCATASPYLRYAKPPKPKTGKRR